MSVKVTINLLITYNFFNQEGKMNDKSLLQLSKFTASNMKVDVLYYFSCNILLINHTAVMAIVFGMEELLCNKNTFEFTFTSLSHPHETMIGFCVLGEKRTQEVQSVWQSSYKRDVIVIVMINKYNVVIVVLFIVF